jgi:hypothetical protein
MGWLAVIQPNLTLDVVSHNQQISTNPWIDWGVA